MRDHPVVGIGDPGDEEKRLLPIAGGQGTGWSPQQSGSKQVLRRHRALTWLRANICQ